MLLVCLHAHNMYRSRPQQVRWVLNNVTLVLPQDSEMSYVTYMFTLVRVCGVYVLCDVARNYHANTLLE